jgi:hypothetical protein
MEPPDVDVSIANPGEIRSAPARDFGQKRARISRKRMELYSVDGQPDNLVPASASAAIHDLLVKETCRS